VGFLGVTFKANTDDMRDSSCLKIIPALIKKGCLVNYYDPTGNKTNFDAYKSVHFFENANEVIENSDLLVIHTEWDEFKNINFEKIIKNKNLKIFDLRNLYEDKYFLNKK
jgi:Predicted UDP-glucose 6-dehydrogenase